VDADRSKFCATVRAIVDLPVPAITVEPEDALARSAVGPFNHRAQEIYAGAGEALGFVLKLVGVERCTVSIWKRG
jgi:hypothetical protein